MNYKNCIAIAIILLLSACTNNNEPSNENNSAAIYKPAAPGESLFLANCAACHGADGTAGIANAANLKISKLDSNTIIQTIMKGRGGMPSFKSSLTEAEIHQLKDYVYSLRK